MRRQAIAWSCSWLVSRSERTNGRLGAKLGSLKEKRSRYVIFNVINVYTDASGETFYAKGPRGTSTAPHGRLVRVGPGRLR